MTITGKLLQFEDESYMAFDSGLTSNPSFSGEITYHGGGFGLTAGNLVYYNSSGVWVNADADAEASSSGLLGIAMGTSGAAGVLLRGFAHHNTSNFTNMTTVGAKLYVSTASGAFTETKPTASGDFVRIIGYVVSTASDIMYFCPDNTYVEIS